MSSFKSILLPPVSVAWMSAWRDLKTGSVNADTTSISHQAGEGVYSPPLPSYSEMNQSTERSKMELAFRDVEQNKSARMLLLKEEEEDMGQSNGFLMPVSGTSSLDTGTGFKAGARSKREFVVVGPEEFGDVTFDMYGNDIFDLMIDMDEGWSFVL